MKFGKILSRIFPIILAVIMAAVSSADFAAQAASKRSKAKITQTSSRSKKASSKSKKKSGKKSKKTSSKSKKKSGKKSSRTSAKSKRKSSTRRWTTHREAPVETASSDSLTLMVNNAVLAGVPANLNPGGLRVNRVIPDHDNRTLSVKLNDNFTYLPVTNDFINDLQSTVRKSLPDSLRNYRPDLMVGSKSLSYYISKIDKLPVQYRKNVPFVREAMPDASAPKGMQGDILAMWHSHGRYYKNGAWQWQRPLLFETVEDIYTMGYVLPYIVPMIENAGGYVMLPRERDVNPHEVIVDNDKNDGGELYSQPYYAEKNGATRWENGEFDGFIYDLATFRDTENPFEIGTYRQTSTVKSGSESVAAWYADIPEDGEYAVYVSYKSLPESTTDARYTVHYSGGSKDFLVNQTMGGGTWIYLGTFPLRRGYSDQVPVVSLTNRSDVAAGKTVTADAVKIGGGMGNIERSPRRADVFYDPSTPESGTELEAQTSDTDTGDEEGDDEDDNEEEDDEEGDNESDEDVLPDDNGEQSVDGEEPQQAKPAPEPKKGVPPVFRTSGLPRFLEGARYWLHWAGIPEDVYSPYHGRDDYKDDYTGRALWVNYLAGGSRVLPNEPGLGIPVDAAFALHSDAGRRSDESTVGTLGIYYTQGGISYEDGTPRINSRMLTDYVMRQITSDVRQTYNSSWTRRSMWDKSYVEARVPEVPTTLIELLSHQNFGDMQYGLDPNFRFLVSRAIYKAIARFMAERKDREVVIQPLPVKDFAITRAGKGHFKLQWKPTPDPLEPTAMPKEYIIYERRGSQLGFHKIGSTSSTHYNVKVKDNDIYSFRIVAVNEGGKSFDSETLSCREASGGKPVMIVNGFTRISAPGVVNEGGRVGFDSENDFGVPYIRDISFAGHQREFRRSSGDLGRSDSGYISTVIAGNTFDYPYMHGTAIANAGCGFVSCSVGAVTEGSVNLRDYDVVDLILGKQKEGKVGCGQSGWQYKTFPEELQKRLRVFVNHGGDLFVSGQYVASDLYSMRSSRSDQDFATQVLGITPGESEKVRSPRFFASPRAQQDGFSRRNYSYNNNLNRDMYIVESPDMLEPIGEGEVMFEFDGNNGAAGVSRVDGKSRTVVLSIPFESVNGVDNRNALMKEILDFFK